MLSELEEAHVSSPMRLRRERRPGDLGAITALHGSVYAREYGLDSTFEAEVAEGLAAAARRGWPTEREGLWIVERWGNAGGSVGLTDEGQGEARLRWVVLAPELRGRGLGRRMVAEAVELAREWGYERITLDTFSELTVAGSIYRSLGFELVSETRAPKWGRAELAYQRYELEL